MQELWDAYLNEGEECSGYAFRVWRDEEGVKGFICFGSHSLTEGTYDVFWIAVSPAARRQGVGKALLEATEEEISAREGRKVLIETSSTPAYVPAHRLYASCGYALEAVVHDFYAEGDHLLIYSKHLPSRRTKPYMQVEMLGA